MVGTIQIGYWVTIFSVRVSSSEMALVAEKISLLPKEKIYKNWPNNGKVRPFEPSYPPVKIFE